MSLNGKSFSAYCLQIFLWYLCFCECGWKKLGKGDIAYRKLLLCLPFLQKGKIGEKVFQENLICTVHWEQYDCTGSGKGSSKGKIAYINCLLSFWVFFSHREKRIEKYIHMHSIVLDIFCPAFNFTFSTKVTVKMVRLQMEVVDYQDKC